MKTATSKLSIGLLAFLLTAMTSMSANADDTEIFFNNSSSSQYNPNVLFILDTSGSMGQSISSGQPPKIDIMKSTFATLMESLNNVNVGLMRYNNPGGPILYPVTDIDKQITSATTYSNMSNSSDDAEQSSTGTVTLNNPDLQMTTRISTGTATTATLQVSASADDAEETLSDNTMQVNNSPSLEIPFDNAINGYTTSDEQAVGMIFRNAGIPTGVKIISAKLTFRILDWRSQPSCTYCWNPTQVASGQYAEPLDLAINGQLGSANNNIVDFNTKNITGRSKTTNSVIWSINDPSPAPGSTVTSVDVSNVVQEIVDQSNWSTVSDIALFMQRPAGDSKTGTRDFDSFDYNSSYAPILTVTYAPISGTDVQTVGLHFTKVNIPQGATITSASLSFTAASSDIDNSVLNIYGDNVDNSSAFTTTSGDLNRSLTSAAVSWTPGPWTSGNMYSTADDNVDLKDVVQEIVNRSGWCGGNAMSFIITGSGTRDAFSYDSSATQAPAFKVTYDPTTVPSTGGCMATSLSYRVNTSSDDVEQIVAGQNTGTQYTSSNTLYMGQTTSKRHGSTSTSDSVVGLRFNNIQLPQGATISNAYIEFTSADDQSNSVAYKIYAEDADNPATYGRNRLAGSLSTISTTVDWPSVTSWSRRNTYQSPDIKSLVQALVNRSGWSSGNAMNFIIKLDSSTGLRDVESYDGSASRAPRLVILAQVKGKPIGQTVRTKLIETVNNMTPVGSTPIVDTFYEAARYYRGEGVYWGKERGDPQWASSSDQAYYRISNALSYTGGSIYLPSGCTDVDANSTSCNSEKIMDTPTDPIYISPIKNECQANFIVLLTDGEPTQNQSTALIKSMTGVSSCQTTTSSGECGPELVNFLANKDQSSTVPDNEFVKTYTIGFGVSSTYLQTIADNGNGAYYTASNATDLLSAFNDILGNILSQDTTFVSPGVTVNSFNRLTNLDQIYYALFKPKSKPFWPGNLKRYQINSSSVILDQNGVAAIDPTTGFFKSTSQSFWSSGVDGNYTELGGAAENLPSYSTRNVYTYYSGSTSTTLSNSANAFVDSNTNITNTMLGIGTATSTYRSNLINWARGEDVLDANGNGITTENRDQLNDPLHSVPYLVTYGGTSSNPDITIFYGDNAGFLHAINGATGTEIFSFIPEELLPNLDTLYSNSYGDSHPYGLDGPINAWVKDVNGDSTITAADGDHVYVYFGMRRGGRNYYAIDATDRSNPVLLWKITGGTGDFADLGQTWSRPVKTKVNFNGTVRDVLIFAGGYDPNQDATSTIATDTMGNAIYMVDAATGAVIWDAGINSSVTYNLNLPDMKYSIPADIKAIDVNADGLADQMYVGDTGGQVWRFDINNGATTKATLVTGGVIASLSGTTAADARRFYHGADVSIILQNGVRKLLIAIGSGYQAHPLSTATTDREYAIEQSAVTAPPPDTNGDGIPDYVKLTESDLYDATANQIGQGTSAQQASALQALAAAQGWYITLQNPGEKVLSTPLSRDGILYFTTYEPTSLLVGCVPSAGTSRLYEVNSSNATPVKNLDNSSDVNNLTITDRSETLKTIGIAPDPVYIKIQDANGTGGGVCVGTECSTTGSGGKVTKTYWYNH